MTLTATQLADLWEPLAQAEPGLRPTYTFQCSAGTTARLAWNEAAGDTPPHYNWRAIDLEGKDRFFCGCVDPSALWRDGAVRWLVDRRCVLELSNRDGVWTAGVTGYRNCGHPTLDHALAAAVRAVLVADGKLPT